MNWEGGRGAIKVKKMGWGLDIKSFSSVEGGGECFGDGQGSLK